MKRVWRVCQKVLFSLMVLLIALLLVYNVFISAARASGQALPRFFGWYSAVIISGSMSGSIEVDDVVIAREQGQYAVGDVILFRDPAGQAVCHRIHEKQAGGFVTKGDANNTADKDLLAPANIFGKVQVVLPRLGVIQRLARTPLGLAALAGLLALAVLLPSSGRRKENTDDRGGAAAHN